MKLCDLTYREALTRHPDEVASLLRRLRHGNSKHKNAKPEEVSWRYDIYQMLPTAKARTMLCASIGRWWGRQPVENPPELEDKIALNISGAKPSK